MPPSRIGIGGSLESRIRKIEEGLEILNGNRGNRDDRAVRWRDRVTSTDSNQSSNNGGDITVINRTVTATTTPTVIPTPVPAPLNVRTNGGIATIAVTWDDNTSENIDYAEVYCSDENSRNTAVLIGTTRASLFIDGAKDDDFRYYWVVYRGKDGRQGAYNAVIGTPGKIDSSYLLEVIGEREIIRENATAIKEVINEKNIAALNSDVNDAGNAALSNTFLIAELYDLIRHLRADLTE